MADTGRLEMVDASYAKLFVDEECGKGVDVVV